MRIRLLFLLPTLLLPAGRGLAQSYEPGLLVRSTGDTLRGEIENGFWIEPPTYIHFRTSADSPAQLFQPRQLRAVSFTNGRYFRYGVFPIDHAAETKLERLNRGNFSQVEMDSLLAEVLVEGPATLLRVALPGAMHYLFSTPGRPVLELSERRYLRQESNGAWSITDGNNYRNQLALYLGDCPAAAQAVGTAAFTAEGLAAVAQAYNTTCTAERQPGRSWVTHAKPRRHLSFQGGVLAGARYNRVENTSGYTGGGCVDCQARPFGGFYAELFQPSRTTAIYGELSISNFHSQLLLYQGYVPTTGNVYTAVDYRALLGTARIGVRYYIPLPHEKQFLLGIGYEYNRLLNPRLSSTGAPLYLEPYQELSYATPTILPNLMLGWRSRRITAGIDGQLYRNSTDDGYGSGFFGSNYAVRLSLSYRLSRNPDAARPAAGH